DDRNQAPHDPPAAESYMSVSVAGMPNYLMYGGPSYLAAHGSLPPRCPAGNDRVVRFLQLMLQSRQTRPQDHRSAPWISDPFHDPLKNPRMQDYRFKYEGNRFAFCGNGLTTRETEERDLAWYLDLKDDHHRPRLQV
ncbi:hypothetical protein B0H13DRAFT_2104861, partial [Mycena leptocephala]